MLVIGSFDEIEADDDLLALDVGPVGDLKLLFRASQGSSILRQQITRDVRTGFFQSARPFQVFSDNLLHLIRAQLVVGAQALMHQKKIFRHRQPQSAAKACRSGQVDSSALRLTAIEKLMPLSS